MSDKREDETILEMSMEIVSQRLYNQRLAKPSFEDPSEVVRWFGAVQAQDYLGSLWALGVRMRRAVESEVEQAIADKRIVRSWPLRGTLHYVAADDVRWMLGLVAPRTIARAAFRYKQLELDKTTFAKTNKLLVRALQGDKRLTRPELAAAINRAGISTDGQRLIHILNRAALEGLICYAARRGKQLTFALLDEWAPLGKTLTRDEALAELARRYFTSHGPATLQDYVWWSGLTSGDARLGLEMSQQRLANETIGGDTFWLSPSSRAANATAATAYLLPAYDEYTVAYKDRSALLNSLNKNRKITGSDLLSPTMVINGQVVGTWRRTLQKGAVIISLSPFRLLKKAEKDAFVKAAHRYGAFLGLPEVQPSSSV